MCSSGASQVQQPCGLSVQDTLQRHPLYGEVPSKASTHCSCWLHLVCVVRRHSGIGPLAAVTLTVDVML